MTHRAALYLRVSKSDGSQHTENQRPEVAQLASARGYTLVATYEEAASAVKHRPEYERMMKDARRGKFDVLIVWALDRFGRSMTGNLTDVRVREPHCGHRCWLVQRDSQRRSSTSDCSPGGRSFADSATQRRTQAM